LKSGSAEARFTALAVTVDTRFAAMETRLDAIVRRIGAVEDWMSRELDLLVRMAARMGVEPQH